MTADRSGKSGTLCPFAPGDRVRHRRFGLGVVAGEPTAASGPGIVDGQWDVVDAGWTVPVRWHDETLTAARIGHSFLQPVAIDSLLKLNDGERAYFNEMRGLTTDEHGREILVGLTVEQSQEYLATARQEQGNTLGLEENRARGASYLDLHAIYEAARFQVLAAEHILRIDKPTKN